MNWQVAVLYFISGQKATSFAFLQDTNSIVL